MKNNNQATPKTNTLKTREYFKLTSPQENIFLTHRFYEDTSIANLCGAVLYDGDISEAILRSAVTDLIRRHTAFRLRLSGEHIGHQYMAKEEQAEIPVLSFGDENALDLYASEIAGKPVTAYDMPLYRFYIFYIGEGINKKSGILVNLSHLIADAQSFSLLIREVGEKVVRNDSVKTEKNAGSLSENTISSDYMTFIRSEEQYRHSKRYHLDREFWLERYVSCPEMTHVKTEIGASGKTDAFSRQIQVPADLSAQIKSFSDAERVSPAIVFEAAVILYLSAVNTANEALTIGLPVLNRAGRIEKKTVGMFISTIPFTVRYEKSSSVRELLLRITAEHYAVFRHQRYPFSELLKELRRKHNFSHGLYDVMVSFQDAGAMPGIHTKWYFSGYSEIPLAIHIDDRDCSETYTMTIEAQKALFPQEKEIELLAYRLLFILSQIISGPDRVVSEIQILPEPERQTVKCGFNSSYSEYPGELSVHELFTRQAGTTPDKAAIIFENQKFTFRQIDEMSNALACFLRKKEIAENEVVPMISMRDWRIIVAMLGIWKAGGAFMPVSPDFPKERIITMLDIAKCRIALSMGVESDTSFPVEIIDLAAFDFSQNTGYVDNRTVPEDLCYIIFTSGSTGTPKAAALTNRNLLNYICYARLLFKDADQVISATIPVFDGFFQETIVPICLGKTVVFASEDQSMKPNKLWRLANGYRNSFLFMTPTKWQAYLRLDKGLEPDAIRLFCGGGEALSEDLVRSIKDLNTNGIIINDYGPSETTIASTCKLIDLTEIGEETRIDITIGRPIANTQIYILDDRQNLLPIGAAGELCIAGDGVGKGYLNRPDLTAERFIPNPFATEENGHGKVLYRTGDLARWRVDGEIEYLGRIDTQVKIRGLRIELGEIESVMAETEGIGLTAAAAQKDENGRQYLVGYYTSDTEIDEKELRGKLTKKLPKYMVPNYFMRLTAMPMTASGKTDRKNLPVPDMSGEMRDYAAPVTETEIRLCRLMEEILSIERIGTQDDFFELGGDSLKAISFVAMAHEAGIEISLQGVYDHASVQEMCKYLQAQTSGEMTAQVSGVSDLHAEAYKGYQSLLGESVIDESLVFHKKALGNVLLTGATGFLGAHILDALMKHENGLIYCLVRGETDGEVRTRLDKTLRWYFGGRYHNEIGRRIIPVRGSVGQEHLSDGLPEDVQTVIHAAALVKHFGKYEVFRKVNVEGTEHVIRYAEKVNALLIHISTASISGYALAGNNAVESGKVIDFSETDYYIGQSLENVYIRSKFEAERVVLDAIHDGRLSARIIRIGNLTNRTGDFRFQPNYESNAFLRRMKAFIDLGAFPEYLLPCDTEFSPVDLAAEGIVKIAQYADRQIVFHLFNDRLVLNERLISMLRKEGIPMDVISDASFRELIERTIGDPRRSHIYEALETVLDQNGKIIMDNSIHVNTQFTDWFLSKTGFRWSEIDEEYIDGYISYFREAGYLKA